MQNIVDAADGYNMDVNIKKVLSGMGFPQETWQKNIAVLSGGELTRLRLAKLLLEKPDVLILDEPTNHLDSEMVRWLAQNQITRREDLPAFQGLGYRFDSSASTPTELIFYTEGE